MVNVDDTGRVIGVIAIGAALLVAMFIVGVVLLAVQAGRKCQPADEACESAKTPYKNIGGAFVGIGGFATLAVIGIVIAYLMFRMGDTQPRIAKSDRSNNGWWRRGQAVANNADNMYGKDVF